MNGVAKRLRHLMLNRQKVEHFLTPGYEIVEKL